MKGGGKFGGVRVSNLGWDFGMLQKARCLVGLLLILITSLLAVLTILLLLWVLPLKLLLLWTLTLMLISL
jgi:hypothetical protein